MLHTLRHARTLARLVLVWFVLSVGVAVASPSIQPQGLDLVCTGTGVMKVVSKGDAGGDELRASVMDCPMCATVSAPPPLLQVAAEPPHPLSYALLRLPAARLAALTGAPLPARGPPTSV